MLRILQFLYGLRALLLFVLLEVLAIWLIVANQSPQGAAFFNSSSAFTGSVLNTQNNIVGFFSLGEENDMLVKENAELLAALAAKNVSPDSSYISLDSAFVANFEIKGAKIISNSLRFSQNHLTLNRGELDGIKPGMGIFNQEGIVGRVKSVSKNYAVAISLLNTELLVSSKIKSTEVFGSVQWDGQDSKEAKLLYVPRHVKTSAGDTVVTSGFNTIFPEGIPIGIISSVGPSTEDPNYLEILLELSTDFSKVNYVYLVENNQKAEIDSLYIQSEVLNEF